MHLLFEGITMYETKLILQHLIYNEQYFSLDFLNTTLLDFLQNLQPDQRPNSIRKENITSTADNKIKQTAYHMWIFSHILPLLIGDKVPAKDEKWINFIRLLQIQQLCTCPVVISATMESLTNLIANHNMAFQKEYPESSYIPKMHYLVHLPKQMQLMGPLRNHWCMRMEAKNGFFKKRKLRNTKNVPKSVSIEHQRWMCCQQRDNIGCNLTSFLKEIPLAKPGKFMSTEFMPWPYLFADQVHLHGKSMLVTEEAEFCGVKYNVGQFVTHIDKDNLLSFIRIIQVLVYEKEVMCIAQPCHILYFDVHRNSYIVQLDAGSNPLIFYPSKAIIPWPVPFCDKLFQPSQYYLSPMTLYDIDELP
jgi:hypothetical protein